MSVTRGQTSRRNSIIYEAATRSIEEKVLTMCILKAVYISVEYNLSDLSMQLLDVIHV